MIEVLLGARFPNTWQGRLPGATAEDNRIWQRWHALYGHLYAGFYFNVRLMSHIPVPIGTPEEIARGAQLNAAKRIDVLADQQTQYVCIELRAHAGLSAIGALVGYYSMLLESELFQLPISLLLVTDSIDRDVLAACRRIGIQCVGV